MKILITTDWYQPIINGVVTSVINLKKELEERGHEVRILTLSWQDQSYIENKVYYLKSADFGKIYPNARAVLSIGREFIKELTEWAPDLVHSQCEFMTYPFAAKISRKCGCPLLHTYHTIYEDYIHYLPGKLTKFERGEKFGRKFVSCFSRKILSKVDQVIVPTEKVKEILKSYQVKQKMSVIPTGIDLRKFSKTLTETERQVKRAEFGIPANHKVLVNVGRLGKEKNLEEILNFMAKYQSDSEEKKTPLSFLVVGDGPDRERLENLAVQLGMEKNVHFTGMVEPEKIADYYHLGDVFVCASNSETQGITYIEAMACELPVLCRKDACLDDIVSEGYNGFQYESYEFFKMHLSYILEDAERREQMGKAAGQTALEFSTWNFCTMVERVYREALEEKRLPAQMPAWNTSLLAQSVSRTRQMLRRVS